jgi:hypothetical protein
MVMHLTTGLANRQSRNGLKIRFYGGIRRGSQIRQLCRLRRCPSTSCLFLVSVEGIYKDWFSTLVTIAASCQMERYFSKSGLMVTAKRHNLKSETVRASQLVSSWDDSGLLPKLMLIKMFEDKKRRPKLKAK